MMDIVCDRKKGAKRVPGLGISSHHTKNSGRIFQLVAGVVAE